MGIADREGDLTFCSANTVVCTDTNDLTTNKCEQRHGFAVVHMQKAFNVAGHKFGAGREEAHVERFLGKALVELLERGAIRRPNRPDVARAPIAQHHVRFPVVGVGVSCGHSSPIGSIAGLFSHHVHATATSTPVLARWAGINPDDTKVGRS